MPYAREPSNNPRNAESSRLLAYSLSVHCRIARAHSPGSTISRRQTRKPPAVGYDIAKMVFIEIGDYCRGLQPSLRKTDLCAAGRLLMLYRTKRFEVEIAKVFYFLAPWLGAIYVGPDSGHGCIVHYRSREIKWEHLEYIEMASRNLRTR